MTVIEPGERQRGPNQHRCQACRCLFGYGHADFLTVPAPHPFAGGDLSGVVRCPNCGTGHTVILVGAESARREFPRAEAA